MRSERDIPMKALQRADKLLGPAACALLQPLAWLRPRSSGEARRVLAIKFWGVGSLQLLTPAVASLRRRHPKAEIALLTLAANRDFAKALGVFDRVITVELPCAGWGRVLERIARLLAGLRRERFDEVYDFEFFTRFSAVVSLLSGAPRVHGFAAPGIWRGRFHTDVAPFNRYWHVARNFRSLAGGEDGAEVDPSEIAPLRCTPADERLAAARLSERGISSGTPYAVLNPNAGQLSLERRWPPGRFAELARRLWEEDRLAVALIGSRSERAYTEAVAVQAGAGPIADLAGELSCGELAALLARAAVVVTNDSGPMHVAAALGTPTVGLFGPETPVMYEPLGRSVRALYRPPPCSPCINVHDNKLASCVWGAPLCLVAIPVEAVLEAARALRRPEPARPALASRGAR
jgi:lipopolysaccharide heptosyltransferase II